MILWTIYGPLERSSGESRGGVQGARAPLFRGKKKKELQQEEKPAGQAKKKTGPPLGSRSTCIRQLRHHFPWVTARYKFGCLKRVRAFEFGDPNLLALLQ